MGPEVPGPRWWHRALKVARAHHRKTTLALVALGFGLAIALLDSLLAGPLRSWAERTMNAKLQGYRVHIGSVRLHLWKLAFELDNVVLTQTRHPDPPVADFGALKFSLVSRELLQFRFVGDLALERPALHINLAQIEEEASRPGSLGDRGWQRAVESIYPIKLNQVSLRDGSLHYLSGGTESKPLQFTKVSMVALNVRNMAAAKDTYPSPVHLQGLLFESGKVWFQGAADFLREPHAAARGALRLENVPLDRLNPLASKVQLRTSGGLLSANGDLEYTPESQMAHFRKVVLEALRVDYITSPATQAAEKRHGKAVAQLAKRVRNAPRVFLKVDSLQLRNSQVGFVNQAGKPPYRLFFTGVGLDLDNLSNQADQGRSTFKAHGAFMGSGTTALSGGFRPTASPADFDVRLKLDGANLVDLNGFLMSYAGFDVAEGVFSDYTELTVKNGRIEGYTKPLVKHLRVYDRQKDRNKPFGKRVKMRVYQVLANLFRNHASQDVATVIRISGSTSDPKTSTWEVLRKLIGNGLGRAILPGFLTRPKPEAAKAAPKGKGA